MTDSGKILVIGATGHVGGQVVSQLARAGVEVRALARNPAAAAFPPEIEVVPGDLAVPDTLVQAMDGVDAVFMTWPMLPAENANSVAQIIADHADRIVLLSSAAVRDDLDEQDNPIGAVHAAIEGPIVASGLDWTFLRPRGFATNTLDWAQQIRSGDVVRGAYGSASMALLHEADIAAVAVRALTTEGHVGAKYELTGPVSMSRIEQVEAIGAALDRRLVWEEISHDEAKDEMVFVPRELADFVLYGFAAMRDNPDKPTSTVQDVTGSPARTLEQWAADHAADFI